jgi:hypothetical protein
MGDRETFEKYLELCRQSYDEDKYPALRSVIARMAEEARQHGMMASDVAETIQHSFRPSTVESEYETIHSRIAECLDVADRARCALTLLLQSTVSSTGYLFGTKEERSLQLMAALPDLPSRELERWIERYAREALDGEEGVTGRGADTGDVTGTESPLAPLRFVDADGRTFEPALLYEESKSGRTLAAALVIQTDPLHRTLPSPDLRSRIGRELILHADVVGWRREP